MSLQIPLHGEVDDGCAPAPDDLEQVKATHPLEHLLALRLGVCHR